MYGRLFGFIPLKYHSLQERSQKPCESKFIVKIPEHLFKFNFFIDNVYHQTYVIYGPKALKFIEFKGPKRHQSGQKVLGP